MIRKKRTLISNDSITIFIKEKEISIETKIVYCRWGIELITRSIE